MLYANFIGVDQYYQIKDITDSLRTADCNITDEWKNTADTLETIIKSKNMNLEEVKKI